MTKRPKEDGKEAELKEISGECKFPVESVVWCPHGPLLYRAKVLKMEFKQGKENLFVHFDGWNKKHDSWVDASECLENNDEAAATAKKLLDRVKEEKANKKRKNKPKKDSDDEALVKEGKEKRGRKRLSDNSDTSVEPEADEESGKSQKVCLKIPGQIKKELIHDWESITKNSKIVTLPRPAGTVNDILGDFIKAKTRSNSDNLDHFNELCEGIKVYFDRALPFVLLYNQERPQYQAQLREAGSTELVPSDIYGAEHLSRLFVKFPELLAHTQLSTEELGKLQPKLADFLKWFAKNSTKYFGKHYTLAPGNEEDKVTS